MRASTFTHILKHSKSKMKAVLLVNRVWDVVSGRCTRPNPAPALVFGEGVTNQPAIDAAIKRSDDFEDAYNKAACLIAESISDTEIRSDVYAIETSSTQLLTL